MGKTDRRTAREQSRQSQLVLPMRELVREALFDTVIVSGLEFVGELLKEQRTALCRPRYQHNTSAVPCGPARYRVRSRWAADG